MRAVVVLPFGESHAATRSALEDIGHMSADRANRVWAEAVLEIVADQGEL